MTFLTDWAKTIVYYILFVKLLTSLIPSGNMSKYIKLFSGILLIIILVQPLLNLKSMDESMFNNILKVENELDHENLTKQAQTYQKLNDTLALDLYIKNTKRHIVTIAEREDVQVVSINLVINEAEGHYGEVISMDLVLNKEKSSSGGSVKINEINVDTGDENLSPKSTEDILIEKNIKSDLLDFYNVPADNIHISIEKN